MQISNANDSEIYEAKINVFIGLSSSDFHLEVMRSSKLLFPTSFFS